MKMVIDRNIVISRAGSVLCTQIERAGRIDKNGKNLLPSVKQWRLKLRVFSQGFIRFVLLEVSCKSKLFFFLLVYSSLF